MIVVRFFQRWCFVFYFTIAHVSIIQVNAQPLPDHFPPTLTLPQCVEYALKNQPYIRQSQLDEAINRKDIAVSLSGWMPQLGLAANLQHYIQLPTSFFPSQSDPSGPKVEVTTGLANTSAAQFSAYQTLYSTDLVFAGRTVKNLKERMHQITQGSEINTVKSVTKSFYDVMLSIEQLELWNEEIERLERSYEDALHLFQNGLTDKIDYQQALISVNNARAQKRNTVESVKGKYAELKQSMGYPPEQPLLISYDSAYYEQNILADTLQKLNYGSRVEYQLLQTEMQLQNAEIGYYKWSFLPTVSAFYDYNLNYYNDNFPHLYDKSLPNSLVGITIGLPIFQGTKRLQNLQKAHLKFKRMELDEDNLKNQINTEYVQALASYKSNLYSLAVDKSNIGIAQEVYNIVSMQYKQGIKTYLDVIVAETDLRSAKLNYLSTLFQVLSSKLDLNTAMGDLVVN